MRTPNGSRFDQRLIEATQSIARTFSPSWNTSPSRRVKRQRSLSSESSWPAAICGCTLKDSSRPKSWSHVM